MDEYEDIPCSRTHFFWLDFCALRMCFDHSHLKICFPCIRSFKTKISNITFWCGGHFLTIADVFDDQQSNMCKYKKTHTDVTDVWAFHVWFVQNKTWKLTTHGCVCVLCKTTPQWVAQMWFVCNPHTCHSSSLHAILGRHVGNNEKIVQDTHTHTTHSSNQYERTTHAECNTKCDTWTTHEEHMSQQQHHMPKWCNVSCMGCENNKQWTSHVVWWTQRSIDVMKDKRRTWRACSLFCVALGKMLCKPSGTAESDSESGTLKAAHFTFFKRCLIVVAELTWQFVFSKAQCEKVACQTCKHASKHRSKQAYREASKHRARR